MDAQPLLSSTNNNETENPTDDCGNFLNYRTSTQTFSENRPPPISTTSFLEREQNETEEENSKIIQQQQQQHFKMIKDFPIDNGRLYVLRSSDTVSAVSWGVAPGVCGKLMPCCLGRRDLGVALLPSGFLHGRHVIVEEVKILNTLHLPQAASSPSSSPTSRSSQLTNDGPDFIPLELQGTYVSFQFEFSEEEAGRDIHGNLKRGCLKMISIDEAKGKFDLVASEMEDLTKSWPVSRKEAIAKEMERTGMFYNSLDQGNGGNFTSSSSSPSSLLFNPYKIVEPSCAFRLHSSRRVREIELDAKGVRLDSVAKKMIQRRKLKQEKQASTLEMIETNNTRNNDADDEEEDEGNANNNNDDEDENSKISKFLSNDNSSNNKNTASSSRNPSKAVLLTAPSSASTLTKTEQDFQQISLSSQNLDSSSASKKKKKKDENFKFDNELFIGYDDEFLNDDDGGAEIEIEPMLCTCLLLLPSSSLSSSLNNKNTNNTTFRWSWGMNSGIKIVERVLDHDDPSYVFLLRPRAPHVVTDFLIDVEKDDDIFVDDEAVISIRAENAKNGRRGRNINPIENQNNRSHNGTQSTFFVSSTTLHPPTNSNNTQNQLLRQNNNSSSPALLNSNRASSAALPSNPNNNNNSTLLLSSSSPSQPQSQVPFRSSSAAVLSSSASQSSANYRHDSSYYRYEGDRYGVGNDRIIDEEQRKQNRMANWVNNQFEDHRSCRVLQRSGREECSPLRPIIIIKNGNNNNSLIETTNHKYEPSYPTKNCPIQHDFEVSLVSKYIQFFGLITQVIALTSTIMLAVGTGSVIHSDETLLDNSDDEPTASIALRYVLYIFLIAGYIVLWLIHNQFYTSLLFNFLLERGYLMEVTADVVTWKHLFYKGWNWYYFAVAVYFAVGFSYFGFYRRGQLGSLWVFFVNSALFYFDLVKQFRSPFDQQLMPLTTFIKSFDSGLLTETAIRRASLYLKRCQPVLSCVSLANPSAFVYLAQSPHGLKCCWSCGKFARRVTILVLACLILGSSVFALTQLRLWLSDHSFDDMNTCIARCVKIMPKSLVIAPEFVNVTEISDDVCSNCMCLCAKTLNRFQAGLVETCLEAMKSPIVGEFNSSSGSTNTSQGNNDNINTFSQKIVCFPENTCRSGWEVCASGLN